MAKELKIEVVEVRDVETKSGLKFKAYKTVDKNGKMFDLKFRRDAKNIPSERCYIFVDSDKCNVTRNTRFPCCWVNTVNRIEPLNFRSGSERFFETADTESAEDVF